MSASRCSRSDPGEPGDAAGRGSAETEADLTASRRRMHLQLKCPGTGANEAL